ncbi:MAG: hypothetical protein M1816_005134 [Peltula sp. TS41687]|nr:MAG: hypothetical protein M1816_005134 [Peltula sp. TS41687]
MFKQGAFTNTNTPQHPTPRSTRPFIQPGLVANRIQAYNQKSINSIATARPSRPPDDVQRLLTRLRQHSGVNNEASAATVNREINPGNGPVSGSPPLATGSRPLSIYGKRQGGGWASPAGRRISIRGQDVPVDLYIGADNPDAVRIETGLLRATGHIGGQSSAPLDIVVPRLAKAVSNDGFERVRVVRSTADGLKVQLNPTQPEEVDAALPIQGISEDIRHPGGEGPTVNDVEAARYSSAIPTGRDISIYSELPETLITQARRDTVGSSLYSRDAGYIPGGGLATDIELMHLIGSPTGSFRDDRSFGQPYGSGDLKSYSASHASRGSSSRRSESKGRSMNFPEVGEAGGTGFEYSIDDPMPTKPETQPFSVLGMYAQDTLSDGHQEIDRASRSDRDRPSLMRQDTLTNTSKPDLSMPTIADDRRLSRPKLSKLPRHSASVASLNAVLRRHDDSRELLKSSTWSVPTTTTKKSSNRKFSLLGFFPSLFSWNERQDNSKLAKIVSASETGTEAGPKSDEVGLDPAAEPANPPGATTAGEAEAPRAPTLHSTIQEEESEHGSTDGTGARGEDQQLVEPEHDFMGTTAMLSTRKSADALAGLRAAADKNATTRSNSSELGTVTAEEGSEKTWTETTGPHDDISQSTGPRGRLRRRPGSPPTTTQESRTESSQAAEQHAAAAATANNNTALVRSPSALHGHSQQQSVAKNRRICVVIDAKEDVEMVVSVQIGPHVATSRVAN